MESFVKEVVDNKLVSKVNTIETKFSSKTGTKSGCIGLSFFKNKYVKRFRKGSKFVCVVLI